MQSIWRDEKRNIIKIAIYWQKEDVSETAREMGVKITDEQISAILEELLESHDATLGISWTTIECAIENILSI